MAMFGASVSRKFLWRLMIAAAVCSMLIGPVVMGWHHYPWDTIPLVAAAIIVLHPVMDRDVPEVIGLDMLRPRERILEQGMLIIGQLITAYAR